MYYGNTETKIISSARSWQGRCDVDVKYSEINAYRDINGKYRNKGYLLTFTIEAIFDDSTEEKTFRKLINDEEVTLYPRYFEPYNNTEVQGTISPIGYTGKLKLKKELLEDVSDVLSVELLSEVDEVMEGQFIVDNITNN